MAGVYEAAGSTGGRAFVVTPTPGLKTRVITVEQAEHSQ
jgi:hypothetical protein